MKPVEEKLKESQRHSGFSIQKGFQGGNMLAGSGRMGTCTEA